MRILDCNQQDDVWFEERYGRVTASRFGDVMNFTETEDRWEAWGAGNKRPSKSFDSLESANEFVAEKSSDKKGYWVQHIPGKRVYSRARQRYTAQVALEGLMCRPIRSFSNAAIRHGQKYEPEARRLWEARTGNIVQEVGGVIHEDLEYVMASPDGLLPYAGFEVKCPSSDIHLLYITQRKYIPTEYMWQCQGGMWVCEREAWHFVSFEPGLPEGIDLGSKLVERDDHLIERLDKEVPIFWKEVCSLREKLDKQIEEGGLVMEGFDE